MFQSAKKKLIYKEKSLFYCQYGQEIALKKPKKSAQSQQQHNLTKKNGLPLP